MPPRFALAELRARIDRVSELLEARLPAAPEPAPIDPDDDLIGVSEFQEFESVWAPVFEH